MDNAQRISRIQSLGYNAQESAFLCAAALHSGFFLRRQYSAFTCKPPGYADVSLGEKVLGFGHAKVTAMRHNRMLYHLHSKPFYAAMGEGDNRNRREREPQSIKRRLMMLDFVIANPAFRFFPTEGEKVAFFCAERGINVEHLPSKLYCSHSNGIGTTRYFVDKSPIYMDVAEDPKTSAVHFCFVDEGLHSTSGFEQYLQEHCTLFARVEKLEVVYIACSPDQSPAAELLFTQHFGSGNRAPVDPLAMRLVEYFKIRAAYERRDMGGLSQAKLIQLRTDRAEFSDSKYEQLFARWKSDGDASVIAALCPESIAKPTRVLQFRTVILPHTYELLGTLTHSNFQGKNADVVRK